jgi:hypothetical protein
MEIFDAGLAEQDLFGPQHNLALALENIYYSASSIDIRPGARILWYVSQHGRELAQQVRACSLSLGTELEPASALFRRFSRLGVYRWSDILERAKGDPRRPLRGYRFHFTELLKKPVVWEQLQRILTEHRGRGNPVAGPVRLSNEEFVSIYRAGQGLQ